MLSSSLVAEVGLVTSTGSGMLGTLLRLAILCQLLPLCVCVCLNIVTNAAINSLNTYNA